MGGGREGGVGGGGREGGRQRQTDPLWWYRKLDDQFTVCMLEIKQHPPSLQ